MSLSRRRLLRLLSGAAVSVPLLDARFASAAGEVPRRFIVYQTPEGNLPTLFKPAVLAGDALQLSTMLAPLAAHQAKLCVVSGVSNRIAPLHPAADGHTKTGKTLMSADVIASSADGLSYDANRMPTYGQRNMGPSIDHALADKLRWPAPLNLALATSDPGENTMFYRVRTAASGPCPVAPLTVDPAPVFAQLTQSTMPPSQPTRRELLERRRGTALAAAKRTFDGARSLVSQQDRLRLEEHLDALNELEKKLAPAPSGPVLGCTPGPAPSGYVIPSNANGLRGLNAMADVMIELMVRVAACDVRRVITLQDAAADSPPWEFLPSGGIASWHVAVHNNWDNHNPTDLRESFLYYAQTFAKLLGRLDQVVEPNGRTLLDNSLVLWISEFGTGATHDADNLPVVLAGGANGAIRMNRHVNRPGATTNDLFTSVLQAFGLPDTSFGFSSSTLNHGGIGGLL